MQTQCNRKSKLLFIIYIIFCSVGARGENVLTAQPFLSTRLSGHFPSYIRYSRKVGFVDFDWFLGKMLKGYNGASWNLGVYVEACNGHVFTSNYLSLQDATFKDVKQNKSRCLNIMRGVVKVLSWSHNVKMWELDQTFEFVTSAIKLLNFEEEDLCIQKFTEGQIKFTYQRLQCSE